RGGVCGTAGARAGRRPGGWARSSSRTAPGRAPRRRVREDRFRLSAEKVPPDRDGGRPRDHVPGDAGAEGTDAGRREVGAVHEAERERHGKREQPTGRLRAPNGRGRDRMLGDADQLGLFGHGSTIRASSSGSAGRRLPAVATNETGRPAQNETPTPRASPITIESTPVQRRSSASR